MSLDTKLDKELAKGSAEHKEITESITIQKRQINSLERENKRLSDQNSKLQNDILNTQREMLRLKVNVTGINEGHFKTYDRLPTKVAEAMMPICEGQTDDAKWNASINIPITDCQ